MRIFDNLKESFRKAVSRLNDRLNQNYLRDMETDFKATPMSQAIDRWLSLYVKRAGKTGYERTLGLPAAISSELARLATLELVVTVSGPNESADEATAQEVQQAQSGNSNAEHMTDDERAEAEEIASRLADKPEMAELVNAQIKTVIDDIEPTCARGCAGGGLMFKPYIKNGNSVAVEIVPANRFIPTETDSTHRVTSCIFIEQKNVPGKNIIYTRYEEHKLNLEDFSYTVTNKAYKSYGASTQGSEIPLMEVPEWAGLAPVVNIPKVNGPLFAYFKTPLDNTVDLNSELGVSVFAPAEDLIADADEQYSNLCWEFKALKAAVFIGSDYCEKDDDGKVIYPNDGDKRFIEISKESSDDSKGILEGFAPAFRDVSIKSGLNAILQKIELKTGLAYGTISDPMIVDKTAEEIRSSKQRSYATVSGIQRKLEVAIEDLARILADYNSLYLLAKRTPYDISIDWGDSILTDPDKERANDRQDVRDKIMHPVEYRMKYFHESREEAEKALKSIEEREEEKADKFAGIGV